MPERTNRQQVRLLPLKELPPRTMNEVSVQLGQKQGLFLNRLASLFSDVPIGWETIAQHGGEVWKRPGGKNTSNVFTGKLLCEIAARALCDGLSSMNDRFIINQIQLDTFYNAENWKLGIQDTAIVAHDIVKITDRSTGESVFVDPTYAQVDHQFAGRFLICTQEDLSQRYRNASGKIDLVDVTAEKAKKIQDDLAAGFPNPQRYQRLIQTIAGR